MNVLLIQVTLISGSQQEVSAERRDEKSPILSSLGCLLIVFFYAFLGTLLQVLRQLQKKKKNRKGNPFIKTLLRSAVSGQRLHKRCLNLQQQGFLGLVGAAERSCKLYSTLLYTMKQHYSFGGRFPLPCLFQLRFSLQRSRLFSCLMLCDAYNLVAKWCYESGVMGWTAYAAL